MSSGLFNKIQWGDGLAVTDEGDGVIRVDSSGGGGDGTAGPPGPAGPTGPSGVIPGGTRGQALTKQSSADGDSIWSPRVTFPPDGAGGDLVFGGDTNLYRAAAGDLKTDGRILTGGNVAVMAGAAQQLYMGDVIGLGQAGIVFGNAGDTNLYRSAAGRLKTNSRMLAVLGFNAQASVNATDPAYQASVAGDTQNRYSVQNDGRTVWGPGGATPADTALYRGAANELWTDGSVLVAGGMVIDHADQGNALYFGSALDAWLYVEAGALKYRGSGGTITVIAPA